MAVLPQAQSTFVPCSACSAKHGTKDFNYCDGCVKLRDQFIADQQAQCVPTCSNCEQRPPHEETATLCKVCLDAHSDDDGSKRSRMTAEDRERASNDKLTHEVMPPLPPEMLRPTRPSRPKRSKRRAAQ